MRDARRALALLVIFGLVLGLGVAELLARALVPSTRLYLHDPQLGHRLAPNQRSRRTGPHGEFDIWMSTNSHGDPDTERSVENPPGTYRIAVTGDSIVEASQVNSDQRFTALWEQALNRSPAQIRPGVLKVEVLNFGVAGYGTGQEWLLYQSHIRQFRPDVVVAVFFPTNDVRNNSYDLEVSEAHSRSVRPFFTLEAGRLVRVNPARPTRAPRGTARSLRGGVRWVVSRLRIAQIALATFRQIRARANPERSAARRQLMVDVELYDPAEQQRPQWRQAWAISGALLQEFAAEVRRDCALFVVAIIPGPREVNVASRDILLDAAGVPRGRESSLDWTLPHRRAVQMIRALGLDYVDLYPAMASASAAGRQTHFTFDGHLTPVGHTVAAEWLRAHVPTRWSSAPCP